jgi:hypothetical protein
MWVLIALFVGGEIFGFLGVLLAVPTAAVIKIFLTRAVDMYHESDLFLEGPASLRSIPPAEPIWTPGAPPSSPSTAPPPVRSSPSASSTPAVRSSPSATATPLSRSKTPPTGSVIPPRKPEE